VNEKIYLREIEVTKVTKDIDDEDREGGEGHDRKIRFSDIKRKQHIQENHCRDQKPWFVEHSLLTRSSFQLSVYNAAWLVLRPTPANQLSFSSPSVLWLRVRCCV